MIVTLSSSGYLKCNI